ncbi:hypothetical protein Pdw03_2387 [Penicillium digitatum]|uniref:Uncharacterized protein n=1 Tax=Penicillium digitatum TaxID=36651 RepID=A0A7T6XE86_PENDI|nr:hypothetical protein Pdw03_2387 [Penicillium digitatum]
MTYAKFTNVPPDVAKLSLSKGCRQMYNPDTRGMIVTIPGKPHDAVTGEFHSQFAIAAYLANMKDFFWSLTIARVEAIKWPSLVLEVGLSESRKKLLADAWWLANSQGEVHVVIITSVNLTVARVTFETIGLEQPSKDMRNGRRLYRTETRQSIVVSRVHGGPGQPITTVPNTSPIITTLEEVLCRPSRRPIQRSLFPHWKGSRVPHGVGKAFEFVVFSTV